MAKCNQLTPLPCEVLRRRQTPVDAEPKVVVVDDDKDDPFK